MALMMDWRSTSTQKPGDQTWRNYQDYTNRMKGYGGGLMQGVMAGSPLNSTGQLRSQYTANPSGPGVANYLANVSGGQRAAADQYAQQAGNMAIANRGRNFVRGGMNPQAAQAQGAVQGLAGMYGQNFRDAMSNEWRGADAALNAWRAQGGLGAQFGNQELAGLKGMSDMEWRMWQDDLEREKLAEDTRRWNLGWASGQEDRQRQWQQEQWRRQQERNAAQQTYEDRQRSANNPQAVARDQMETYMRDIAMKRLQDQAGAGGQTLQWQDYLNHYLTGQPLNNMRMK